MRAGKFTLLVMKSFSDRTVYAHGGIDILTSGIVLRLELCLRETTTTT